MPATDMVEQICSEQLLVLVKETAQSFCYRFGLTYNSKQNAGLDFVVSAERCHLEYPGLGLTGHFSAKVKTGVVIRQGTLILFFVPDHGNQGDDWALAVNLATEDTLLSYNPTFNARVVYDTQQALHNAWRAEERALEQYRRQPIPPL